MGYVRVSSVGQNTARQLDGLLLDRVFEEKASAKDAHRPQLQALLAHVREGDTVVCECLRLLAPNLSGSLSLWRPNDECASGGFDDVFGDGVEVVDSQDAVDLGEEAVE